MTKVAWLFCQAATSVCAGHCTRAESCLPHSLCRQPHLACYPEHLPFARGVSSRHLAFSTTCHPERRALTPRTSSDHLPLCTWRVIQPLGPRHNVPSRAPSSRAAHVIQSPCAFARGVSSRAPPPLRVACHPERLTIVAINRLNEREGSPPKTRKAPATAGESDRRSFALIAVGTGPRRLGALDDTRCAGTVAWRDALPARLDAWHDAVRGGQGRGEMRCPRG